MEHEGNPGLHVKCTRPPQTPAGHAAWHSRQRTERIHRVQVSQKQDWLSAASAREINLQVIAKLLDPMKLCVPAQPFESSGKQCPQPVYGVLVVAGRLDLRQLMNTV